MSRVSGFVKDCRGGVGIDWIVLGAGLLMLGVMLVHDVYQGARRAAVPADGPTAEAPTASMDRNGAQAKWEG